MALDIPNLDALSPDDLDELRVVFHKLSAYCDTRSIAMLARAEGNTPLAARLEGYADYIYKDLPEWARW
jgi:hypothetical protein